MPKAKTKPTTIEDIAKMCKENHIWINAMSAYRPTDAQCMALGRQIYEMLNNSENLIPSYSEMLHDGSKFDKQSREAIEDISELTPMLYLSVNKS